MKDHRQIWDAFCELHNVNESSVLLFEASSDGVVAARKIGLTRERRVLKRSVKMESAIREECAKLISDWQQGTFLFDGLIYMIGLRNSGGFRPLYIGKTETLGKNNGNISANIKDVDHDTSKFACWGDNYAYHIGDLSAVVLPGHETKYQHQKYQKWAEVLFNGFPSDAPTLKQPVYFWAKAWPHNALGPWQEFGATRLTFLEYLLIGLASSAFGNELLNREGHNRQRNP